MRAIVMLAFLAASSASAASAQCPRETLSIELPAAPPAGPRAEVEVVGNGGDPWATPDGGFCVVQDRRRVHVAPGQTRQFAVGASEEPLLEMIVGGEALHVSMPPGSRVRLVASVCTPFAIEGADLDVVDHHGERPGAESSLFVTSTLAPPHTPYGGECSARDGYVDARTPECHTPAQPAYCTPARIRHRGRVHSFWPRSGERWRVSITSSAITTARQR